VGIVADVEPAELQPPTLLTDVGHDVIPTSTAAALMPFSYRPLHLRCILYTILWTHFQYTYDTQQQKQLQLQQQQQQKQKQQEHVQLEAAAHLGKKNMGSAAADACCTNAWIAAASKL
jgi:hypothetical protein